MGNTFRRLFIALPVDDESAVMSLDKTLSSLKKFDSMLKIVQPGNYHITVKFLGQVEETMAELLIKEFSFSAGLNKTGYRIEGIGAFPSQEKPSVIWAGLKCNEEQIKKIFQEIEKFTIKHGFPPEKRNFSPHLTLARVRKEKKVPQQLKDFIKQEKETVFAASVFKELVLYESILKRTGPEYIKIAVINLKSN
jgi:RNA 2',3'-cyclic 3'-phosphodiesterase